MKYLHIENSDLLVSNLVLGCMRLPARSYREAETLVWSAVDAGVNFFDHADIYGNGEAETLFGRVLKANPSLRGRMLIQSKCGIVRGKNTAYYDFSKKHILEAVEGSLARLGVETLDVLLLHRPDALMDPMTVAQAFRELRESGKVRYFGVSNFNAGQLALLRNYAPYPILFNQLQMSVVHCPMIDAGLNVNRTNPEAADRDGSTLDYCRLNGITIQAWSVMMALAGEGTFLNHPKYGALNDTLETLGKEYGLAPNAMAVAWLLRHPAKIQAVAGTTSPEHLAELAAASEVRISREHWYDIYTAAGKIVP